MTDPKNDVLVLPIQQLAGAGKYEGFNAVVGALLKDKEFEEERSTPSGAMAGSEIESQTPVRKRGRVNTPGPRAKTLVPVEAARLAARGRR